MSDFSLALVPLDQVPVGDNFYLDLRSMLPLVLVTRGVRYSSCCLVFDTLSIVYLRNDQKVVIRYDSKPKTLF